MNSKIKIKLKASPRPPRWPQQLNMVNKHSIDKQHTYLGEKPLHDHWARRDLHLYPVRAAPSRILLGCLSVYVILTAPSVWLTVCKYYSHCALCLFICTNNSDRASQPVSVVIARFAAFVDRAIAAVQGPHACPW